VKVYGVKESECFPDGVATIYTVDEAKERGIKFVPLMLWRRVEEGQYVATTDGHVTPVIKRVDSGQSYIKTPTGCFHLGRNIRPNVEEFHDRNSFTSKSRWNRRTNKLTKHQETFFKVLGRTLDVDHALKVAYPNYPKFKRKIIVKEIVKSDLFRRLFVETNKELAKKLGLSNELIVRKLVEWIASADEKTSDRTKLLIMGDRVLNGGDLFEPKNGNGKSLPPSKEKPLFSNAEDAQFEEQKQIPDKT